MNESYVTLQGWVGDVSHRSANGVPLTTVRVASTPRYLKNGAWVDGETAWYTVNCWRHLGENSRDSVRVGDAVIVHGRVRVDVWSRDKELPPSVAWIVDATFIGHDLNKGTSVFAKTSRAEKADPAQDDAIKAMLHGFPAEGPKPETEQPAA